MEKIKKTCHDYIDIIIIIIMGIALLLWGLHCYYGASQKNIHFEFIILCIVFGNVIIGYIIGFVLNNLDKKERISSEDFEKNYIELNEYIKKTENKKVKKQFKKLKKKFVNHPPKPSFSFWIGFLERLLYMFCFLAANAQLFTAIIAIKTFMRFPEIKKGASSEITAEKYILGTLLNITFALIGSLFILMANYYLKPEHELIRFLWEILSNSSS